MAGTLQNRLVGTIIVVALVVILLPELLDGEKKINTKEFVSIPEVASVKPIESSPQIDTQSIEQKISENAPPVVVLDEPAIDEAIENSSSNQELAGQTSTDDEQTPVESTITQTSISNDTNVAKQTIDNQLAEESLISVQDSAWVVQLGSFRYQKNVKELLNKLDNAGYRAYSRPVQTSVGELTKVFVGPELERETLELALPHLQEITNLKGKITSFEVSAE